MKLVDLLSGYADADWGNSSSGRSTSGMVMLYNKSPIMWKPKMQNVSTQAPNGASRAVGTHYGPTRIHAPTGAYAIGGTATLA